MDFISIFTLAKISLGVVFAFAVLQVMWFFKPWRYFLFDFTREYQKMIALANRRYSLDFPISVAPTEFAERLRPLLPERGQEKVDAMNQIIVGYFYQQNGVKSSASVRKAIFAVQKTLKGKHGNR